jgi:hypothetical protein
VALIFQVDLHCDVQSIVVLLLIAKATRCTTVPMSARPDGTGRQNRPLRVSQLPTPASTNQADWS